MGGCSGWDLLAALHTDGRKVDTQNYSEVFCGGGVEAQNKQPSGQRMGKLKVAVYGEGALADSGNGLKRGKKEHPRSRFSSYAAYIISPHIADGGTG